MDPTAIRDQIETIRRSQSFASKGQLRKLLEILSKYMDSQTTLKPDQVIQELWPAETRTKRSGDVATEINRLRHALDSYYSGEGRNDPITISLPNRSVPGPDGMPEKRWIVAKPREAIEEPAATNDLPRQQVNSRKGLKRIVPIIAVAASLTILAYISFPLLWVHDEPKLGRLDGSALVIMNAEGKELWRKVFPDGFGPDWYYAQG